MRRKRWKWSAGPGVAMAWYREHTATCRLCGGRCKPPAGPRYPEQREALARTRLKPRDLQRICGTTYLRARELRGGNAKLQPHELARLPTYAQEILAPVLGLPKSRATASLPSSADQADKAQLVLLAGGGDSV